MNRKEKFYLVGASEWVSEREGLESIKVEIFDFFFLNWFATIEKVERWMDGWVNCYVRYEAREKRKKSPQLIISSSFSSNVLLIFFLRQKKKCG